MTVQQRLEKAEKEPTPEKQAVGYLRAARFQLASGDTSGARDSARIAFYRLKGDGDANTFAPRLVDVGGFLAELGELGRRLDGRGNPTAELPGWAQRFFEVLEDVAKFGRFLEVKKLKVYFGAEGMLDFEHHFFQDFIVRESSVETILKHISIYYRLITKSRHFDFFMQELIQRYRGPVLNLDIIHVMPPVFELLRYLLFSLSLPSQPLPHSATQVLIACSGMARRVEKNLSQAGPVATRELSVADSGSSRRGGKTFGVEKIFSTSCIN
jgi:hypothetical protein